VSAADVAVCGDGGKGRVVVIQVIRCRGCASMRVVPVVLADARVLLGRRVEEVRPNLMMMK